MGGNFFLQLVSDGGKLWIVVDWTSHRSDGAVGRGNGEGFAHSGDMLRSMGAKAGVEYMQVIAVEDAKLIRELKTEIDAIAKGYSLLMAVNSDGAAVQIYRVTQVFKDPHSNKRAELQEYLIVSIAESEGVVVRLVGNDIKLNEATSILDKL